MTKIERNDIAAVISAILSEECDEIRANYYHLYGNLIGFRKYVRQEVIEFWTNHEPYLDKEYVDISIFTIDGRIINFDKVWCFIRDGIKFDIKHIA